MTLRSIQILRALAAMAVVIAHIQAWEQLLLGPHAVVPGFFSRGFLGVELFFVISGFIMVYIQPEPLQSVRAYGRFLFHRAARIYPPYWMVLLPILGAWLLMPSLFTNRMAKGVALDFPVSLFLLPQAQSPLLTVAWTLIHEIYFYLVVSLALVWDRRGRWIFGLVWFVVVLSGYGLAQPEGFRGHPVLQLVFSPYSLVFLLGYFLGLVYRRADAARPQPSGFFVTAAALALGILLGADFPDTGNYPNNNSLSVFLLAGPPCALLVLCTLAWEERIPKSLEGLVILGNSSYALYLIHVPALNVLYQIVARSGVRNSTLLAGIAVVCLGLCLVCGELFHRWLEYPVWTALKRWGDRFFPERKNGASKSSPSRIRS